MKARRSRQVLSVSTFVRPRFRLPSWDPIAGGAGGLPSGSCQAWFRARSPAYKLVQPRLGGLNSFNRAWAALQAAFHMRKELPSTRRLVTLSGDEMAAADSVPAGRQRFIAIRSKAGRTAMAVPSGHGAALRRSSRRGASGFTTRRGVARIQARPAGRATRCCCARDGTA